VLSNLELHYLSHLAKLGATNVHPRGREATGWLLSALDLRASQRVLEIGCGTGETMLRVAAQYGARVDGLDVLPEMLRAARLRLKLAGVARRTRLYKVRPSDCLPFEDATYERAYTESVLGFQDASSARRMLSEIYRVLKPGGIFAANEAIWKVGVQDDLAAQLNRNETVDFGLGQASEQAWSVDDWLGVMREAGFEIVSADKLNELAGYIASQDGRRATPSLVVSALLTNVYRLKGYLDPRLVIQDARYRRLLRMHSSDGEHIEGRLFVLRKPEEARA
jgi:cyclopropane fatty-acyl-phospholipid synthase-like methyltransferase